MAALGILVVGCEEKQSEVVWNQPIFQIGSQSSPRVADLNQDGVLDIVMGAGLSEVGHTLHGVIAFDGKSGSLLWQQAAEASIVGSATFLDITGDSVPEVFIGGRARQLMALNGQDGSILWTYSVQDTLDPILRLARYNFYNSTWVPDQNGDGFSDLLTVNGGNWDAPPHDMTDRHAGVLMLIDPTDGAIIQADTMPDGMESYMSPVAFSQPGRDAFQLLVGTGGETAGGHLYLVSLEHFMESGLKHARTLAEESEHGYIAPPSVVDLNADGTLDIVAASHAATLLALDGQTLMPLWQRHFPGMETSNAFAIGYFNRDDSPDILSCLSKGTWPDYQGTHQMVLDGRSGETIRIDSLGCGSLSSPVVYDLNGDGVDEAFFSVNQYDCDFGFTEDTPSPDSIFNQLVVVDYRKDRIKTIDNTFTFKNLFSTPWLGDLDADGYLDIVYPQYYNPHHLFKFQGMRIRRISSGVKIRKAPHWGAYMGTDGTGVFQADK